MPPYRTFANLTVLLAALQIAVPAAAQGLAAPSTVDAIVGSEVKEQEATATASAERIVAAIAKSAENSDAVRRLTQAPKIDIVFISDATAAGGGTGPIDAKLKEHADDVRLLRQEIEGNALLFHAIDSRQVILRDILAVEIGADGVTVFAAAKPAG